MRGQITLTYVLKVFQKKIQKLGKKQNSRSNYWEVSRLSDSESILSPEQDDMHLNPHLDML